MKTVLPSAWRAALLARMPRKESDVLLKALRPYTDFTPDEPLPPGYACAEGAWEPAAAVMDMLKQHYENAIAKKPGTLRPWAELLADWADQAKQVRYSPEKKLGPPKRFMQPEVIAAWWRMKQKRHRL